MHYSRENDTVSQHSLLSSGTKRSSRIRALLIACVVVVAATLVAGVITFIGTQCSKVSIESFLSARSLLVRSKQRRDGGVSE